MESCGFLLFIPGVEKPHAEAEQALWKELGIWDFFDTCGAGITNAPKGPAEGLSGIIVAPQVPHRSSGIAAMVGWYPEKQNWVLLDDKRNIYVGWYKDKPPRPKDLHRPRMFDGVGVQLGDGNEWQIPIIHMPDDRFFHSASTLPQAMYRVKDENGKYDIEYKVRGDYLDLVTKSNSWVDRIIEFQDAQEKLKKWENLPADEREKTDRPVTPAWVTPIEEFDWIADCVQVNYRVMPRVLEGDVLGVATSDTFFKLLHASLGMAGN